MSNLILPRSFAEQEKELWSTRLQAFYTKYAAEQAARRLKLPDPLIDCFLKTGIKNILDVGCGPGQHVSHFLREGRNAMGIDFTPAIIEEARKKYPFARFDVMSAESIGYPDEAFDGIWSSLLFVHIDQVDTLATLRGFNRVLSKGGFALIETDAVNLSLKTHRCTAWSIDSLRPLCTKAGFKTMFCGESEVETRCHTFNMKLPTIWFLLKKTRSAH